MGIPILQGRDFDAQDKESGPGVLIVNEELARRYFSGNALANGFGLAPIVRRERLLA